MQQTETYKLNLIDKNDAFSPDPLNDNTRKLENALSAETQARQESGSGLEQRVTALESHKLATGAYTGTVGSDGGNPQTIELGFTPKVVVVQNFSGGCTMAMDGHNNYAVKVVDGGFSVSNSSRNGNFNYQNSRYYYFAFV